MIYILYILWHCNEPDSFRNITSADDAETEPRHTYDTLSIARKGNCRTKFRAGLRQLTYKAINRLTFRAHMLKFSESGYFCYWRWDICERSIWGAREVPVGRASNRLGFLVVAHACAEFHGNRLLVRWMKRALRARRLSCARICLEKCIENIKSKLFFWILHLFPYNWKWHCQWIAS